MKNLLLTLTALLFISCADSFVKGELIVQSVKSREEGNINYPEYKYYVIFKNSNNSDVGLLTNVNYKVGDTLK
jgi:hypothetical protein